MLNYREREREREREGGREETSRSGFENWAFSSASTRTSLAFSTFFDACIKKDEPKNIAERMKISRTLAQYIRHLE
jgi:hypothetical protein